jgi:membrane protease YdiL (CAAX protease family)
VNILEFLTVVFVGILPGVISSLIIAKEPEKGSIYGKYAHVLIQLTQSLAAISLLLFIASQHADGKRNLGLSFNKLGFGEVAVLWVGLVLLYLYAYLQKEIQKEQTQKPANQIYMDYQTKPERTLCWISMVFAVCAEDLLYRGYLVLWIGEKTGNLAGWAIISVGLSVLVHLYQGITRIGYHIIMASTFVIIAFMAGNIYLVIVFHIFWNTLQITRLWEKMDSKKKTHDEEIASESTNLA